MLSCYHHNIKAAWGITHFLLGGGGRGELDIFTDPGEDLVCKVPTHVQIKVV